MCALFAGVEYAALLDGRGLSRLSARIINTNNAIKLFGWAAAEWVFVVRVAQTNLAAL